MAIQKPKLVNVKILRTRQTGEMAIRNGILAILSYFGLSIVNELIDTTCMYYEITVCEKDVLGVTLVPGRNVAILFTIKDNGGSGLLAPGVLSQEVPCRNRNTKMTVKPTNPAVHRYAFIHTDFAEMRADDVGPASVPKSKHQ